MFAATGSTRTADAIDTVLMSAMDCSGGAGITGVAATAADTGVGSGGSVGFEEDQDVRAMLYSEAMGLIGADYPVITVSLPGSIVAMSDAVKGYVYNVAHHQTFNYMDISVE